MSAAVKKQPLYKSLYFQVIVAIMLGMALGYSAPQTAIAMKPLGDGFIKLIKMLIPPIIFCTVVGGVAGMRNMKNAGRVGLKALVYFEGMTTFALLIGLVVMHVFQPGTYLHVDPATLDTKIMSSFVSQSSEQKTPADFILAMIPSTVGAAFVNGDMLQVLLVSILIACALIALGNRSYHIYTLIQEISEILYKVISFIVRLAPLGAFGAMAFTIGKYGIGSLGALASFIAYFYTACVLFILVVLGVVMRACGLRIVPFLNYIKEEIFIVLGTASSEVALPRIIEKMAELGCARPVVGMVIPTGYSFNLDGTSIYLTMAALFVAQALGIHLTAGEEATMFCVLLLTSKGAAGVAGSSFLVLAGTLASIGKIPAEGLALILGIDRFMSEAKSITNMIGNGVGTVAIAKWERAIDMEQAKSQLGLDA